MFTEVIFWVQISLIIAQIFVYGTLTAGFIYSGRAHVTNTEVLGICYKLTFSIFDDMRFSPPMLSFDFDLWAILRDVGDVGRMMDFDPGHFVDASRALGVLSFLFAQVKVLVSGATYCRMLIGSSCAASIPFHIAAGWNLKYTDLSKAFAEHLQKAKADTGDDLTKTSSSAGSA